MGRISPKQIEMVQPGLVIEKSLCRWMAEPALSG